LRARKETKTLFESHIMDRKDIRDAMFPDCPIRNVLSRMMDKWTLLALYTLEQQGTMRFNDLRRSIPDVSQKMLTVTLKSMEADGLVSRKVIPAVPVKVEYTLTDRAMSVMPLLDQLLGWSLEHFGEIIADRQKNLG
jgi:DNA-binding HxlR family transcriptional regulator